MGGDSSQIQNTWRGESQPTGFPDVMEVSFVEKEDSKDDSKILT